MSNWTSNQITLTGDPPRRQTFKDAVAGAHEAVDFGRFKPIPGDLTAIQCGTATELGLAGLSQEHFDRVASAGWFAGTYPHVRTMHALRAKLERSAPEALIVGRQALANIRTYGVPTWYEWCLREWGTKWNPSEVAVDDDPQRLTYRFDTAWDAPRGIVGPFVDLAHSLGLSVVWVCRDEGGAALETLADEHSKAAA
jgi:hypothetical protein